MDIATQWLVRQGLTGQWGTESHSDNPRRIEQCTEFAESGGLWIALDEAASTKPDSPPVAAAPGAQQEDSNDAGELKNINGIVGAICVGDAVPYVKPATEPELYIRLLLTDRNWNGRGLGTMLLQHARELAHNAKVSVLRVDCYAGGNGKLVRYYESQGFERVESFEEKGWPGQVLVQRLGDTT